jgi:hypothetical protein
MKKCLIIPLIGIIIFLFLSGCQSNSPETLAVSPTIIQSTSANTQPEQVVETPEVSEDTGGFRVKLLYQENGSPVQQRYFYLAEMIPVQGKLKGAFVPALDTITAPKAESNSEGEIIISMVEPNKYALTFLTPLGPILVDDAETEKEITLEIFANEIFDLGTSSFTRSDDFKPKDTGCAGIEA